MSHALARLEYMRVHWHEIQPVEQVRAQAERLLRVHPMRAGDALQLAAALLWCNHDPRSRHVVSADDVLSNAAETEGFSIVAV
ncbi:MAG: hypothetical protein HY650_00975 [Acidobacteria bacterium]|nr:hypothetical protein [Acidobacteriota bacterium]